MKISLNPLAVVIVVLFFGLEVLEAQNQAVGIPPQGSRRPPLPLGSQQAQPQKQLSANYRIVLSGKSGEKTLGELACLSCSPTLVVSGPLDASNSPTSMSLSGELVEQDGGLLILGYSLSFSVPVTTGLSTGPGNNQQFSSSVQYQTHNVSGSLLLKPGKSYELLKAGGTTYSVTITPEPEK